MALFDDARVDSADLADLVNGSGLVTTRYGDNPKKSWKYMENEFDTMLSTLQADGESQITVIVNDLESSGEAQLTTVLAGIQSGGDAAIENFTVNGERAIDDFNSDSAAAIVTFNSDGESAINLFNTQAANDLAEFDQALDQYKESRGFNNKGTFADGFTYELPNDVGIDASGNPWIYNGTLPFTVTAGTTPASPTYTQVTYGTAAQVSMNTSDTVQSFADSFALKIFQSPTDGGLTEIQTRTVDANKVYEVRKTSGDSLATIYSDAAGTNEIVQNGTDNKSGSDGVVDFYISDGAYYVEVGGVKSGFITLLKTEFETVEDAKNYSGIEALLGGRVYLKDRQANFNVVLTSSVTPNGASVIQSTSNSSLSFLISENPKVSLSQLGAVDGALVSADSAINAAATLQVQEVIIDGDYLFYNVTIDTAKSYSGSGSLIGQSVGAKPSVAAMKGTDSAGRLSLLQSYNPSNVSFIGASPLYGVINISNALITCDDDEILIMQELNLTSCSMHNCFFRSFLNNSVINAPYLIASDSPEDGVFIERGGQVYMQFGEVYKATKRGCHAQLSGYLEIQDGGIYDSEEEQVFSSGKTEIVAKRTTLDGGNNIGFLMIYGGSGDLLDSVITNNQGAGLVVESNSTVLAEGSTITGNGISGAFGDGVSTSYGGFAQVRYSTITGNGGYACATRTGGEIQAQGCIVDKSNNSGGVQFFAQVNGHIILDEMGDENTPLLTNQDCHPVWGTVGNGLSFCGRDNGVGLSETGFAMCRLSFGRRGIETILAGEIDLTYMYTRVATEGGGATDDLQVINRSEDEPTDVCYIQPYNNGETITIKTGLGNIVTSDGLDITLDAKNRVAMLVWNSDTQRWMARVI